MPASLKNVKKDQKWGLKNMHVFLLFFAFSFLFAFVAEKDGKTCFNAKEMILTREWHAEHLFAGQNTQQSLFYPAQRYKHFIELAICVGFVFMLLSKLYTI